jgi:8-oxo-dGTP pyrophosphatase MutT (NUDIX family)
MVRRHRDAAFMGDARVFPGGSVDDADRGALARRAVRWTGDPTEHAWRAAGLRELAEEAGIAITDPPGIVAGQRDVYTAVLDAGGRLDADRLAYLSNWVTPELLPIRFDTRFYVAVLPEGTAASADRREVFDPTWVTPHEALQLADSGRWVVEFPTRRHLELLAGFDQPDAAMAYARAHDEVPRVEPRVETAEDGSIRVVVPGETGVVRQ